MIDLRRVRNVRIISRWSTLLITVFLLFLFSRASWAESQPVSLTADDVQYDYETKQLEAVGNAKLTYKDIKVDADKIIIDQDQNILLATGNIRLTKKDQTYHGNTFLYYLKLQQGWVTPLSSDLTDPEITGAINLDAAWALIKKDDTLLNDASFTSCDLSKPHYHFTAASVDYYPEKRIIFHHVWYWEHQIKLLYLPYLVISLEDKDSNFEVEAGWKKVIGWFLYIGYNYYINEKNDGKIKLNLTELGGNGIGVEHRYKIAEKVKLTGGTDYYDNGNYNLSLRLDDSANEKLPFSVYVGDEGRRDGLAGFVTTDKAAFNLSSQIPYVPSVNFSYTNPSNQVSPTYDISTRWNFNLDSTFNLLLDGRWYISPYNNSADFALNATKNFGWSRLQFKYNESSVFYKEELKPELTFTIPDWKAPFVGDVLLETKYTRKEYGTQTGERDAFDFVKLPVTLWTNTDHKLTLKGDGSFKYRYYQVADSSNDLGALTGKMNLIDQFTKEFSGELGLSFTQMDGIRNSFFTYDSDLYPGATLTNNWNWTGDHLTARLTTGYNFQTETGIPVNFNSRYFIDQNRSVSLSGTYDWYFGMETVNTQVTYNPNEKWKLNMSLGYDFRVDKLTNGQFEAQINDRINQKIGYELASRYDFFVNRFSTFKVALTYDLHCRELKVSYDAVQELYWVQILIKAFPQAPLRLDSDGLDLSVFNF